MKSTLDQSKKLLIQICLHTEPDQISVSVSAPKLPNFLLILVWLRP